MDEFYINILYPQMLALNCILRWDSATRKQVVCGLRRSRIYDEVFLLEGRNLPRFTNKRTGCVWRSRNVQTPRRNHFEKIYCFGVWGRGPSVSSNDTE